MNNHTFYDQKLIEQLATNAETFGSTELTEDVLRGLDTWEMTPEQEFYEAVYLYENFGIKLPEEFNEDYHKLLEEDKEATGKDGAKEEKTTEWKQYDIGDLVMVSPSAKIGLHRLLIVKQHLIDDKTIYEGHILSSKVKNSNKYNLRYPNNIYINVYDHILIGKHRGVTRSPCYINVGEYFKFSSEAVQGSGSFKGTVTKEFLDFVQECERRVSSNDNQYWRWINGKAVNEEPAVDMTDKEYKEALKFW